jgi:hypothetical protein
MELIGGLLLLLALAALATALADGFVTATRGPRRPDAAAREIEHARVQQDRTANEQETAPSSLAARTGVVTRRFGDWYQGSRR